MSISIQAQSVIFNNDIKDLIKALEGLANAVRNTGEDRISEFTVKYGDASPNRVLSETDVEYIRDKFKLHFRFDYVFFGFNSGSARGQNMLAKDTKADYIFIMNPDVIMAPNSFIILSESVENSSVGMVEARQSPIEHHKEYDVETLKTDWATGACTLVRTKLFKDLDGFDADSFFMYCDDVDLSWRVRLSGYDIIYRPDAMAFHAKRLTIDAQWQPSSAELYYSAEAAIMMSYKWSNDERLEYLLATFSSSGEGHKIKAVNRFLERKKLGKLPRRLDPEHKVSFFNGDYYSENRFLL